MKTAANRALDAASVRGVQSAVGSSLHFRFNVSRGAVGYQLSVVSQCMPGAATASGALLLATSTRKRPPCKRSSLLFVPSTSLGSVHRLPTSTLPEPAATLVGWRRCLSTVSYTHLTLPTKRIV